MSDENICTANSDGQHNTVLNIEVLEMMAAKHVHANRHKIPLKCFDCGLEVVISTGAFAEGALEWSGISQRILEGRTGDTEDEVLTQIAIQLGYPMEWDRDDALRIMTGISTVLAKVRPNPQSVKTGTGDKYLDALHGAGIFVDPAWVPHQHYDPNGHRKTD